MWASLELSVAGGVTLPPSLSLGLARGKVESRTMMRNGSATLPVQKVVVLTTHLSSGHGMPLPPLLGSTALLAVRDQVPWQSSP